MDQKTIGCLYDAYEIAAMTCASEVAKALQECKAGKDGSAERVQPAVMDLLTSLGEITSGPCDILYSLDSFPVEILDHNVFVSILSFVDDPPTLETIEGLLSIIYPEIEPAFEEYVEYDEFLTKFSSEVTKQLIGFFPMDTEDSLELERLVRENLNTYVRSAIDEVETGEVQIIELPDPLPSVKELAECIIQETESVLGRKIKPEKREAGVCPFGFQGR